MILTKTIAFLLSLFTVMSATADDLSVMPTDLLSLDEYFSHHVIVAEKSTHKLYIFKNNKGEPELIKTYQMATGKKAGDKIFQGDHRTPEGVYYLTDFLTHQDLISRHGKQGEIYGVGAFVLNYPNPIDDQAGKTGGGIWLHSTNDETRIEKGLDSRGCIVTANSDLINISKYIELHKTPMVVTHELTFLNRKRWETKRDKIRSAIMNWVNAWREENLEEYISHYHEDFIDPNKGRLNQFKAYKRAVFNNPGKPEVEITDISLIQSGDYVRATFRQEYRSSTITDIGRKTLYLKQDGYYNWKIVAEKWSKNGVTTEVEKEESVQMASFVPSQRFFETTNPKVIMGDRLLHALAPTEESKN